MQEFWNCSNPAICTEIHYMFRCSLVQRPKYWWMLLFIASAFDKSTLFPPNHWISNNYLKHFWTNSFLKYLPSEFRWWFQWISGEKWKKLIFIVKWCKTPSDTVYFDISLIMIFIILMLAAPHIASMPNALGLIMLSGFDFLSNWLFQRDFH